MECATARSLIEGEHPDSALAAHLDGCAACRAEAAFARRIAVAVAALPRVPAPPSLVSYVMADVRERSAAEVGSARSESWILGVWELCCIALVSLVGLALIPLAFGKEATAGPTAPTWLAAAEWCRAWWEAVRADASATWQRALAGLDTTGHTISAVLAAQDGTAMVWLWGGAAFAVALVLLLSWRPSGPVEDAHA